MKFIEQYEDPRPWRRELQKHGYVIERHDRDDDPLRLHAEAVARSSLVETTVNVSLAIRLALRRYLGIEPAARPFR